LGNKARNRTKRGLDLVSQRRDISDIVRVLEIAGRLEID
jgi:hypothetical protein